MLASLIEESCIRPEFGESHGCIGVIEPEEDLAVYGNLKGFDNFDQQSSLRKTSIEHDIC